MPALLVYAVVIVAQLADLGTSLVGFGHGAVELNVWAQTPGRLIVMKLLAVVVVISTLYVAGRLRSAWAWHIVALAAILVAGVTFEAAWWTGSPGAARSQSEYVEARPCGVEV